MKKIILVLMLLIVISFASAGIVNVFFGLDRTVYGTNENFDGKIILNHTGEVSVGEKFTASVSDCGDYSKQISLYDILKNSNMANFDEKTYQAGSELTTVSRTFSGGDKKIFAFYLPDKLVYGMNLSVSGSGGPFYLDIGNDGYDWKYLGNSIGWYSKTYSEEYDSSCSYGGSYEIISPGTCEYIDLSFDEFQRDSDIKINTVVRKIGTGNLKVGIEGEYCNLTNVGNDWSEVSCVLEKSVHNGTNTFRVCFSADSNNFQVPTCPGTDYRFLSLQKANYNYNLPSSPSLISSTFLDGLIRDYINDCKYEYNDWCIIPVSMSLISPGSATLRDLKISYTGGTSLRFYDLLESYNLINVNNKEIPLSSFKELKTPTIKKYNCSLGISFLGSTWNQKFSVSDVPKPVINVSADYVIRGTNIKFDASGSIVPLNKSIVKWEWDFGDNSTLIGKSVNHAFIYDGNYTVKLNITDSDGLVGFSEKVIHVINLESFLEDEFPKQVEKISSSISYFSGLKGITKEFYDNMYSGLLIETNKSISNLKKEFDLLNFNSTLNDSNLNKRYGEIASSLNDLVGKTPKIITYGNQTEIENFKLRMPSDIPNYSGEILNDDKRNALYEFNRDYVNLDFTLTLFDVEFLNGDSQGFEYVDKTISVTGGSNNVLVEDLRGFDLSEDVFIFTEGYNLDNVSGVAYWSPVKNIKYVVASNELSMINSVVFSSVSIDDEYVEKEKKFPYGFYIILGIILVLGVIYINFYKGPGNFMQITNSISFKLFHKKLFVTERDEHTLSQFISNAKSRGFDEEEIKSSLLSKGWSSKQISYALKKKR